ncbi:MAG TPA: CHAT domain-containing protein [Pyrinomonadaceae bacterium]|nr:CHAT domain-containing protein [Pyrinomonadaceae bacterium]
MALTKWKSVFALILLGCLLIALPALSNAQTDEQSAVQRVVEQFLAAFQKKDLPNVMALWSEKSPDLVVSRQSMQQTFARYHTIEVKNLSLSKITVDTNKAFVELTGELNLVGTQASVNSLQMSWTIELVKEAGGWKILKNVTREDKLAEALSAASTPEERNTLLNAQPELVTPELVNALIKHARQLLARGKQTEALTLCDVAVNIAQRLNDKLGMFVTLRVKGGVARVRGDNKQALEYFEQCLKLAEELNDKTLIGDALNSIAIVYALQSDYPKALFLFQRNLQIKEELGNKRDIAIELSNIGNIYIYQGDKLRALEHYHRALKLAEEVGDKGNTSATLNSIGNLYYSQGNYAQALEYFQQSLKIKQEIGDKVGVTRALNNIGVIYSLQGQHEQALASLQQNVKILEELGDKLVLVETLHYIGGVYLLKGDYSQALAYEEKTAKAAEELGNNELLSGILHNISETHLRLGQFQAAGEYAERAASLAAQSGIPDVLWKAKWTAGKAHLALNQTEQARQDFLESIATVEKLREQVAGDEKEQQRFFEDKTAPYHAMVQLSLAQQNTTEALSYAERAKGRVLLDVLRNGRANITKAMTDEELKRNRELSSEIASLNTQLLRLKTQSKPPEAQVAVAQAQLEKKRIEYEAFEASLHASHPELKVQRGQTQPLTFDDAVALLPDDQTAILEYVVTEEKSYLFVLRKTPKAELTVHTLNIKSTDLSQMAESFLQRVAERDLTVKQPARKLYDVLIKPAEAQLRAVRKLYIVPDGALWNVPFQALHQGSKGYLLEQYAVSYAPSLSVLREMERRSNALRSASSRVAGADRAHENIRPKLLAMGNPALSGETVTKVRFARRDEPLSPLPDAEKEVNTLGRLYGPGSRVLIGPQARETTMKAEAANYKVLHFATHAILDDRDPLYSHIILSRAGKDMNEDGLMEAWELMKLDLKAELAVLSACQTARGRIAAGEGIIGMSWALFVAGTPAAIVSQWKVDSARSSELMIEFHRNLLRKPGAGKKTLTKSEALRQAALKVFHSSYNHPAYWAGFILIGDDN